MDVPYVVGDWQEYRSKNWLGLRVRVHSLKKGEPARGRNSEAKGLTYVVFQVTFENRSSTHFSIDLYEHLRHVEVRVGRDGHGAFVDERGSDGIRDFNLYPQRRATATIYVAAPAARLKQMDIQISPEIDGEPAFGYVWVGGLGVHEGSTSAGSRASTAESGVAREVERFLQDSAPND
ncbi:MULTISPECIES: hypothetical protein [unclassified Streptomyces]|uniref:hypothetical protein n=1 Tax=unclassified Streptomyces TaxID=2593676 RepID=UPI002366E02C|nr:MULTISPECIES: hypothetical protein [unclassified Streptomyces]MDF3139973.1 hypothetical protein [Streptomyces sp. T21Q-yed]WDF39887.1 hypothetical protein PBV52_25375 [Streptomyces sp. T12]